MEERDNRAQRPAEPRRRKLTPQEIFKRRQLPMIIIGVALVLVIIIIAGAIARGIQRKEVATNESLAAMAENAKRTEEAELLALDAADLVANYDYDGAIALIDAFTGDLSQFPKLAELRASYVSEKENLVTWNDPSTIPNFAFNMLIEDAGRAYNDDQYASSFKRNYVTTTEFSYILEQLYNNGCVLVSLDDIYDATTNDNGSLTYTVKDLLLPAGKTPILMTQTNACYDLYLVDGDGDGFADKGGCGFAHRLILENGNVVSEYIDGSGNTLTGAYDLVPILDAFIQEHPDFSYKGAKAILALSGDEGVFGYRTRESHRGTYGEDAYNQEVENAKAVAQALKNSGYELACYTYDNIAYGNQDVDTIKADMRMWANEVTPIIGEIDTFVFAQKSDIDDENTKYETEKHTVLQDAGFRFYVGLCENGAPWTVITENYVRLGRFQIGGSVLTTNPEWFTNWFNPENVLDKTQRG